MSDPKTNLSSMSKEDPSSTAGVMVQQVLPFALLRGKAMVEKPHIRGLIGFILDIILFRGYCGLKLQFSCNQE